MNGGRAFWNRVNVGFAFFVMVMILLLLSMVSCGRVVDQLTTVSVKLSDDTTNWNSPDWQIEAGGRVGAGNMNNLVDQSDRTYPDVTP